ncbi:MAG TPA: hypothetical protein VGR28_08850 [Candidatus Thermoplasmatota archaeon]|jgi:hypothetical protein|nr:hypothetical protein [Candidatus Thermoplasmatota archaeon]
MRTGKAATIGIAAAMFSIMLIASMPTASACTLISGTSCVMDIYYNERNNAYVIIHGATDDTGGQLEGLQGTFDGAQDAAGAAADAAQDELGGQGGALGEWAGTVAGDAGTCLDPAPSPGPLPVLPLGYDPGPAIDGNLQYVGDQGTVAGQFASDASGDVGPFTGGDHALRDGWANTEAVFERWNERLFEPLIFDQLQGLQVDPDALPTLDVGDVDPTAPDVEALGAFAAERGGCFASSAPELPTL